jgi:hypothetical protein
VNGVPNPSSDAASPARSARRLLLGLVTALLGSLWVGRQFGLGNDELLGYLLASVAFVVTSGIVALALFGIVRLFKR